MSILDGLLDNLDDLAGKLGLPVDKAQAFADTVKAQLENGGDKIAALTSAAQEHGISMESVQGMIGNLGADAQAMLGKVTDMLDKDGDGNPLNDLGGMVKGLFGGKD